jgi:hypothetical protein
VIMYNLARARAPSTRTVVASGSNNCRCASKGPALPARINPASTTTPTVRRTRIDRTQGLTEKSTASGFIAASMPGMRRSRNPQASRSSYRRQTKRQAARRRLPFGLEMRSIVTS